MSVPIAVLSAATSARHMPSDIRGDGNFSLVQVLRVTTPSQIGQRFAQVRGSFRGWTDLITTSPRSIS